MKTRTILLLPLAFLACSEPEREDVTANQMVADDVTEVQDERAVEDGENSDDTNETGDD